MSDAIEQFIAPRQHDVGGMKVRRVLPFARRRSVGPFVFLDHIGPTTFAPGAGLDVDPHPHIGLATITWLFEGALDHRDSTGAIKTIRPGAVNWMTAGRGVVHSERTPAAERTAGRRLHGVQAWAALPRAYEETAPSFSHHPSDSLPQADHGGAWITLIAGRAFGASSPVRFPHVILMAVAEAIRDAMFETPEVEELGLYAATGTFVVDGQTSVSEGNMAVLKTGARCTVSLPRGARCVIVGGAALDAPRVMDWNFVSSSKTRIDKARKDWRASIAGRFTNTPFSLPRGEKGFIPLPEDRPKPAGELAQDAPSGGATEPHK